MRNRNTLNTSKLYLKRGSLGWSIFRDGFEVSFDIYRIISFLVLGPLQDQGKQLDDHDHHTRVQKGLSISSFTKEERSFMIEHKDKDVSIK